MPMKPFPRPGDRVRITGALPEDPAPLPVGTTGTVTEVHEDVGQIHVHWDIARSLMLLPADPFEVLRDQTDGTQSSPVDPSACGPDEHYAVQFRDDDWDAGDEAESSVPVRTAARAQDGRWDVAGIDRWRYADDELIVLRRV